MNKEENITILLVKVNEKWDSKFVYMFPH